MLAMIYQHCTIEKDYAKARPQDVYHTRRCCKQAHQDCKRVQEDRLFNWNIRMCRAAAWFTGYRTRTWNQIPAACI